MAKTRDIIDQFWLDYKRHRSNGASQAGAKNTAMETTLAIYGEELPDYVHYKGPKVEHQPLEFSATVLKAEPFLNTPSREEMALRILESMIKILPITNNARVQLSPLITSAAEAAHELTDKLNDLAATIPPDPTLAAPPLAAGVDTGEGWYICRPSRNLKHGQFLAVDRETWQPTFIGAIFFKTEAECQAYIDNWKPSPDAYPVHCWWGVDRGGNDFPLPDPDPKGL